MATRSKPKEKGAKSTPDRPARQAAPKRPPKPALASPPPAKPAAAPRAKAPTKAGLLALRRYLAIAQELEDLSLGRNVRNDDGEAMLAAFCAGTELLDLSERIEEVFDPPKSAGLYAAFVLRGTVQTLLNDLGREALPEGFLGAVMGLCSEALFACANSAEHLARSDGLWELPEPPAPPRPQLPKKPAPSGYPYTRPMLLTPGAPAKYEALRAAVKKALPGYNGDHVTLVTSIVECMDVDRVTRYLVKNLDCPAMREASAASPESKEGKAHA